MQYHKKYFLIQSRYITKTIGIQIINAIRFQIDPNGNEIPEKLIPIQNSIVIMRPSTIIVKKKPQYLSFQRPIDAMKAIMPVIISMTPMPPNLNTASSVAAGNLE
jgi:hypothetical protein